MLFNSTSDPQTGFGNMVFQNQYLEISTAIPASASLYGFGESTRPAGFRLAHGSKYTLWAADIGSVNPDINLYASLPFYMDVRNAGDSHGVLLMNSNGMDIVYENEYLTYRAIGGVFDFYFFAGPSPLSVMDQYTELVGRPAAMPYWSLGFHQCRYGYQNITDVETVVATYKAKDIPLEVMWNDIDYMDAYKDFTLDPLNYPADRVKAFVDKLHANDQKYVMIIDPGIKYDTNYSTYQHGVEQDIFVKLESGDVYLGQVWPGPVNFPDFLHPNIDSFWTTEISNFFKVVPFDGLWIDMNEISNFCSGISCTLPLDSPCPNLNDQTTCCLVCSNANATRWDDPPYKINNSNVQRPIGNKTIATSAIHFGGILEYDAHNLYGFSEAIATHRALSSVRKKRPFVLSRSTFIGSGAYTAHWTGDNGASWNDLAYSIVSVLNSGLFGIPMVGADICGFSGDTTEELCNRWIQLGAFYPFSRDHSDKGKRRQELYLWDSVAESARKALGLRYQLLPYIYTLVYEAHKIGAPIGRPLFFHFPYDSSTLPVDAQFLLGRSVLVSPVLTANTTSVDAYFPKGTWYNLFNYSQVITVATGSYQNLAAPMDTINVHLHEGSIIPLQEAALTTAAGRRTPFTILVAFPMQEQSNGTADEADGALFLDDGEELTMEVRAGRSTWVNLVASREEGVLKVSSSVEEGGFARRRKWVLQKVVVMGALSTPKDLRINGRAPPASVQIKVEYPFVEISGLHLAIGNPFHLTWNTP